MLEAHFIRFERDFHSGEMFVSDENCFPAVSGEEKCFEYLQTVCHDCRVIKSSRLAATSRGGYPGIILYKRFRCR